MFSVQAKGTRPCLAWNRLSCSPLPGGHVLCVSQPYAFEDGLLRFLAMAWFHGL